MESMIDGLKQTYELNTIVCFAALIIGLVFGWLAEASNFCLRAATAEWTIKPSKDNPVRTVEYLAAMVTSIIVVQILMATTSMDFDQTIYRSVPLRPFAFIGGGLIFGVGMVMAGGCVSRMLVLAGSGNLRSWFTIIILGVSGYATLRGVLSYPRVALEDILTIEGPAKTIDGLIGGSPLAGALVMGLPLAALMIFLMMRTGPKSLLPGIGIGLLVACGWWVTGVLGADEFDPTPLASLTYTSPIGEALQYLMTFTGDTLRFGIALIAGVVLGAFLSAKISGRFKFIGFQYDKAPLRYAAGGLLMGFGGITGLGCPMGQGITGTGTLATGSFLLLISIIISASLTYRFFPPK